MKFIAIFSLMFILLFEGYAAPKIYIKSGTQETAIDSEGVKFMNMKGFKANPFSYPSACGYFEEKSPLRKYYLYNITAVWRYEQTLGRWFAPGGSMIFVKLKLPVPEGYNIRYPDRPNDITKEDFQAWSKSAELKLQGESDVTLWIETFTDCKVKKDEEFNGKNNKVLVEHYSCDNPNKDFFTLTDPANTARKYLMIFDFEKNSDIKKSAKNAQLLASSSSLFTPKTATDLNDKKLVTRKSAEIKDRSPEYIASRDKVVAEIKNLDGWWYVETENYIFAANIKNRKLVDELQVNLEKCRTAYEKYFEPKEEIQAISVVKSFETRDDFLKYINAPKGYPYISMWHNSKEELIISPTTSGSKKDNRDRMVRFIAHEAFHQYMYYACKMVTTAPWFNDGFATLSEGMDFKKNDFDIAPVDFRLERFNKAGGISKRILEDLINGQYGSTNDRDSIFERKCRAWALMYFLCKGAPSMDKKEYALIPFKYYDAVCSGGDSAKATEEAWKDINLETFSSDMARFYSIKKFMTKAEKYDIMKNKEMLAEKTKEEKAN